MHESFSVLAGELTVIRDGKQSTLMAGESAHIEPGVWHDWFNAAGVDAVVRVEVTPGQRFAHMLETLFGLARLGHVDDKGMPDPLQLALFVQEFSDVIVFRRPPVVVQRLVFSALAPIAKRRGYRAPPPSLSRAVAPPPSRVRPG